GNARAWILWLHWFLLYVFGHLCPRLALGAFDDLSGQVAVLFRSLRRWRPGSNRLTGNRGFGETNRAGNNGVKDFLVEVLHNTRHHFAGMLGASVKHGDQNADDF